MHVFIYLKMNSLQLSYEFQYKVFSIQTKNTYQREQ